MNQKNKYIDLHIHSYFSDGMRSIEEIIEQAKKLQLEVISLTDHNNIFGVEKIIALGKEKNIKVIPGIEVYTRYKNQIIHLLGYDFDVKNHCLNQLLKKNQKEENQRVKKIILKFKKLGFKINWPDFKKRIESKFIDNGHIASIILTYPKNITLLKKNLDPFFNFKKNAIQIIIKNYLDQGRPVYVPLACIDFKKTIQTIHGAGGFVVLAHPGQTFNFLKEKDLKYMIKEGLDGMEIMSRHHSIKQYKYYLNLAKKYNLKMTGGTDWHKPRNEERNKRRLKIPYKLYLDLKI